MDNTAILTKYTPLVRQIASGFQRKLPMTVLRDDLIAAGMAGLWDAIIRQDPEKEGFEYYVRVRVRGAILDELRAQDWLPRRLRREIEADESAPTAVVRFDDLSEWERRSLGRDSAIEAEVEHNKVQQKLKKALEVLPKRERTIVEDHLKGKLFKEIAKDLGVSEPRISQLYSRAVSQMREAMVEAQ